MTGNEQKPLSWVPDEAVMQYQVIRLMEPECPARLENLLTHKKADRLWRTLTLAIKRGDCDDRKRWADALMRAAADGLQVPESERTPRAEVRATIAEAARHARKLNIQLNKLQRMGVSPGVLQLPGMDCGAGHMLDFVREMGRVAGGKSTAHLEPIADIVGDTAKNIGPLTHPSIVDALNALLTYFEQAAEASKSGQLRHTGLDERRWLFSRLRNYFVVYFGSVRDYSVADIANILFDIEDAETAKSVSTVLARYTPSSAECVARITEGAALDSGFPELARSEFRLYANYAAEKYENENGEAATHEIVPFDT